MGRLLVRGAPGHAIVPELAPNPDAWEIDKPGRGRFGAAGLHDRPSAAGGDPGPLAGVPFAVRNLVDIAGLTTRGRRAHQPRHAPRDR